MHLLIYFCGTRNPGDTFYEGYNYVRSGSNLSTIFVKGCEDPEVCNSIVFPNLKKFSQRFSYKLFDKRQNALYLTGNDLERLRVGVRSDRSRLVNVGEPLDSITLCGYSRGAVTCFELAKQLQRIAPSVPVDIIADQPVPGNFYHGPGSNAKSIADCSLSTNLRQVCVIIGAYTGAIQTDCRREKVNFFHRIFFSQIVPKLPHSTACDLIVIPRQSHHHSCENAPTGQEHMHMKVACYLSVEGLVEEEAVLQKTREAMAMYHQMPQLRPALFPPVKNLQSIFGLHRKQVYHYADSLYPAPERFN